VSNNNYCLVGNKTIVTFCVPVGQKFGKYCDAKQRLIEKRGVFKNKQLERGKAFLKMLLQMTPIIVINKRLQKPRRSNLKFMSAVNNDNNMY
jgi:hypothetical protein